MKVISIREGACSTVKNHLDSFRADELPTETMCVVLRHLLQCPFCLRELQIREGEMEQVRAAVRGQAVPVELEHRIREHIRDKAEASGRVASERRRPPHF